MISAGSISKILGYGLFIIPGAAKFADPALLDKASVVILNLIGLVSIVYGEFKKGQDKKEVVAQVDQNTAAINVIAPELSDGFQARPQARKKQ